MVQAVGEEAAARAVGGGRGPDRACGDVEQRVPLPKLVMIVQPRSFRGQSDDEALPLLEELRKRSLPRALCERLDAADAQLRPCVLAQHCGAATGAARRGRLSSRLSGADLRLPTCAQLQSQSHCICTPMLRNPVRRQRGGCPTCASVGPANKTPSCRVRSGRGESGVGELGDGGVGTVDPRRSSHITA